MAEALGQVLWPVGWCSGCNQQALLVLIVGSGTEVWCGCGVTIPRAVMALGMRPL